MQMRCLSSLVYWMGCSVKLAVPGLFVSFCVLDRLCNYVGHSLLIYYGVLDGLLSDTGRFLFVRQLGILGELCNYVGHYLFVCLGVLDGLLSDVDHSLFVRLLYNVFDG